MHLYNSWQGHHLTWQIQRASQGWQFPERPFPWKGPCFYPYWCQKWSLYLSLNLSDLGPTYPPRVARAAAPNQSLPLISSAPGSRRDEKHHLHRRKEPKVAAATSPHRNVSPDIWTLRPEPPLPNAQDMSQKLPGHRRGFLEWEKGNWLRAKGLSHSAFAPLIPLGPLQGTVYVSRITALVSSLCGRCKDSGVERKNTFPVQQLGCPWERGESCCVRYEVSQTRGAIIAARIRGCWD